MSIIDTISVLNSYHLELSIQGSEYAAKISRVCDISDILHAPDLTDSKKLRLLTKHSIMAAEVLQNLSTNMSIEAILETYI